MTNLLNSMEFLIVPVVNPDGYAVSLSLFLASYYIMLCNYCVTEHLLLMVSLQNYFGFNG